MQPREGRRRVVIEGVTPEVDCGRFPAKRTVGERVVVEADVFADGHDELAASLLWRGPAKESWSEVPMRPLVNDRWRAEFDAVELGVYRFTIRAWVDRFATWHGRLARRLQAGQNVSQELLVGADMVERAARRAGGAASTELRAWARKLRDEAAAQATVVSREEVGGAPPKPRHGTAAVHEDVALPYPDLAELMAAYPDRRWSVRYPRELEIVVDPERARFSSWYELFPRSTSGSASKHGTFRDVERRLDYVEQLGFDVLYLTPIHPIGRTFRKGKNNALKAGRGDPGSPWAIGSEEGGHTAVHPELGTLPDFERLVKRARRHGIEVALDLALQCSADHPWLREHPEWFRRRPDGTIQYAENPPKKYQDIYPLDFETEAWGELWQALRDVVEFWIGRGVRIFRVDNPHTKPFAFWEWLISGVKSEHPDVIFLAEAFTRPKVMYRLAKLGFTQSYTYFAWRTAKWELQEYFGRDLPAVADFFRPSLWPNTQDILTEELQVGGRPAFVSRLVLAATLGASYGIYGPAFEQLENRPMEPGKEEYLHSEKYEVRGWKFDPTAGIAEVVALVNRIRRENPALQWDRTLTFHEIDNDKLIMYSKAGPEGDNVLLVAVNLDPTYAQSGWTNLWLERLGLDAESPFEVHDLLTDARYLWRGPHNYVQLDPHTMPAHIFEVRSRVRRERDFEYFA